MSWFPTLNLRGKLLVVIATITVASLVTATAIQIVYQRSVAQERLISEQRVLAQLIADRSTAALAFSDERVAQENLSALDAHPAVEQACIYDAPGKLFAGYQWRSEPQGRCPPVLSERPAGITNDKLSVRQPIRIDGERIGDLTLLANLSALAQRTRLDLIVGLSIVLGATLLAVAAAIGLQRLISGPIVQLAQTAARITQTRDYGIRAESTTQDEVGQLVKSFNGMLDAIRERDNSLRESIELLRAEVARRQAAEEEATEAYKQLQQAFEKAVQVEKLSALGTFVGGIAHEINNPLMGLSNFISYVQEGTTDPEHAELLDLSQKQVQRIERIVDRVIHYARSDRGRLQRIDLDQVVAEACLLLKSELDRSGIDLQLIAPDALPQVFSDKDVLDQAVVNLLLNAIHAVKEQPTRTINVELKRIASGTAIVVQDTGPGVPESLRSRIYDPFFTTKPPGQGTGLGLSVALRSLSAIGATLKLDESYREGARFVIVLPDRPPEPQGRDGAGEIVSEAGDRDDL